MELFRGLRTEKRGSHNPALTQPVERNILNSGYTDRFEEAFRRLPGTNRFTALALAALPNPDEAFRAPFDSIDQQILDSLGPQNVDERLRPTYEQTFGDLRRRHWGMIAIKEVRRVVHEADQSVRSASDQGAKTSRIKIADREIAPLSCFNPNDPVVSADVVSEIAIETEKACSDRDRWRINEEGKPAFQVSPAAAIYAHAWRAVGGGGGIRINDREIRIPEAMCIDPITGKLVSVSEYKTRNLKSLQERLKGGTYEERVGENAYIDTKEKIPRRELDRKKAIVDIMTKLAFGKPLSEAVRGI